MNVDVNLHLHFHVAPDPETRDLIMAKLADIQAQLDALKQGNAEITALIGAETAEGAALVAERDDLRTRLAAAESQVAALQAQLDAGGLTADEETMVAAQLADLAADQAQLKDRIAAIVGGTPPTA